MLSRESFFDGVCVCVRACVCVPAFFLCVRLHACVCVPASACAYLRVCTCVFFCACVLVRTCVCVAACVYLGFFLCASACVRTCVCVPACTCIWVKKIASVCVHLHYIGFSDQMLNKIVKFEFVCYLLCTFVRIQYILVLGMKETLARSTLVKLTNPT